MYVSALMFMFLRFVSSEPGLLVHNNLLQSVVISLHKRFSYS